MHGWSSFLIDVNFHSFTPVFGRLPVAKLGGGGHAIPTTDGDILDVFKFANNICEYIFVLSSDFNEFEKRREERTKSKAGTGS